MSYETGAKYRESVARLSRMASQVASGASGCKPAFVAESSCVATQSFVNLVSIFFAQRLSEIVFYESTNKQYFMIYFKIKIVITS